MPSCQKLSKKERKNWAVSWHVDTQLLMCSTCNPPYIHYHRTFTNITERLDFGQQRINLGAIWNHLLQTCRKVLMSCHWRYSCCSPVADKTLPPKPNTCILLPYMLTLCRFTHLLRVGVFLSFACSADLWCCQNWCMCPAVNFFFLFPLYAQTSSFSNAKYIRHFIMTWISSPPFWNRYE